MIRLLRILLAGFAALLALSVVLVLAVTLLVDPDQYRAMIGAAVQARTGRELALEGSLKLGFIPCCGLKLGRATLGNPPGFPGGPFLRIESARLGIQLWPLLTRRTVEIGTVGIDGLEADLIARKDGSNNWRLTDAEESASREAPAAARTTAFSLAGVQLRGAVINYTDENDGSRYRIESLDLTTGPLRNAEPVDLRTSFAFRDLGDDTTATLALRSRAQLATDAPGDVTKILLSDLDGEATARGAAVPGDVRLRFTAQQLTIASAEATTFEITALDAETEARGIAGAERATAHLRTPAATVRVGATTQVSMPELSVELKLSGKDLPGGALPVTATLRTFGYDTGARQGHVDSLSVTAAAAGVQLDLDGRGQFGRRNDLAGALRCASFSPRELLATLKKPIPETADPQVLRQMAGRSGWFLREGSAGLEKMALTLDDTRISGSVSRELLPDGSKQTPLTRFDVALDALNLDRYLAPEPATADGGPAPAAAKPTALPVELLRSLKLDGRARIGQLTVEGVKLDTVTLGAAADGGRLKLAPLTAKLYGGDYSGRIAVDATGAKARLDVSQDFEGVDMGALLTDFANVSNVGGSMVTKITGTAVGNTDDELLKTLDGDVSFSLAKGVYRGMDIWYEIRKARALIRRSAPPPRSGPVETPINTLELTGKLLDGVLRSERFIAEIPFLRVSGKVGLDAPARTLDANLEALVFQKPEFEDGTDLADLLNVRIPLTVSGPVAAPKVRVDLTRMLKAAVTDTVRETVREKLFEKFGIGKAPAEAAPPDDTAAPPPKKKEDPVKKALDRLFKGL